MYAAKKEPFNAFFNLCKSIPTIAHHLGNYFKTFSILTINLAWQMSTNFPTVKAYKIPIYPTS